jgi:hypothetical protein
LLELPEPIVLEVLAVVMAETLASGSELIETLGITLGVSMAYYWQTDQAFYDLLRDKEVATAILAEVGGNAVASANAKEKGKVIKSVISDYVTGSNDRPKFEAWVPRWMAFPPTAYTERGGVTVRRGWHSQTSQRTPTPQRLLRLPTLLWVATAKLPPTPQSLRKNGLRHQQVRVGGGQPPPVLPFWAFLRNDGRQIMADRVSATADPWLEERRLRGVRHDARYWQSARGLGSVDASGQGNAR